MELALRSENSGVCSYTASFNKEEFETFIQKNLGKINEKIKGFRPGKAPAKIALDPQRNSEILKDAVATMFAEAKKHIHGSNKYLFYKEPVLKDVHFGEGNISLEINCTGLELGSIAKISALSFQKYEYEKGEDEKSAYLDLVKDDQIILEVSDRTVQEGDIVQVSGYCLINKASHKHQIDSTDLVLSENIDFQPKLIGKNTGDKVVIEVKYDSSNPNNFLRSKTVEYHLIIDKIQYKPQINSIEDFIEYKSQVSGQEFNIEQEIQKRCEAIAWVVTKYRSLILIADLFNIVPDDKQIEMEAQELAKLHKEEDIESFKSLSSKKLRTFIIVQGIVKHFQISYTEEDLNKFREEFASKLFGFSGIHFKDPRAIESILLEDLAAKAVFQQAVMVETIKLDAVTLNRMLEEYCS